MRQLQVRHPRIELIVTVDRPIRLIHVGQQDIVIEYCPVLSLCYAMLYVFLGLSTTALAPAQGIL
jgi:hypothetical protein